MEPTPTARKPYPSDVSDDEWAFVAPYLTLMTEDAPGFWEQNGYNMHGDPWTEERYW